MKGGTIVRHRGVVVEIAQNNRVIVMTPQGEFIKVLFKKHVHVGQEISYVRNNKGASLLKLGLAATLFLALLSSWPMLTNLFVAPTLKAAYVLTVDLRSSLELQVSEEHRVVSVEGLNQEGKELASKLSLVGRNLNLALREISNHAQESQLAQEQVLVTIASQTGQNMAVKELKNTGSGLFADLEQIVFDAFANNKLAQVRVWQVPLSLQAEAKFAGLAPSRYVALRAPIDRSIPDSMETRLTMLETTEQAKEYKSVTRIATAQADANTYVRPALTPVQWTRESATSGQRTSVTNVNYPIMASKGDFRRYR